MEALNDLHVDLLSVGNAACRAALFIFPKPEERGHKKAFDLPQGEETKAERRQPQHRGDSTPILSVARQSPGPQGPGLDERKKAGLLTSGSSYSSRLTARPRAVASWNFRRPLQRRYRTGFTPVSLFSPGIRPGHFLAGWSRRGGTRFKELEAWIERRGADVKPH